MSLNGLICVEVRLTHSVDEACSLRCAVLIYLPGLLTVCTASIGSQDALKFPYSLGAAAASDNPQCHT